MYCPSFCGCYMRDCEVLVATEACIQQSHRIIKSKEYFNRLISTSTPMAIHLGSVQRKQTKMPIFQLLPGRGLTRHFLSCCLKIQLATSLHLAAECNLPLGEIGGCWHILNYREPLRTKSVAWKIIKAWKTTRSTGWTDR